MIKLCNVMTVELALKRELEYRKKMEALKTQHQSDLNPFIPAQVTNLVNTDHVFLLLS